MFQTKNSRKLENYSSIIVYLQIEQSSTEFSIHKHASFIFVNSKFTIFSGGSKNRSIIKYIINFFKKMIEL